MKLRNKKTGEIIILIDHIFDNYKTLTELSEEWEDYEEPKTEFYITAWGDIREYTTENERFAFKQKLEIGNYFSSREEAEKAVEKLKAWKRLKDKGFRFDGFVRDVIYFNLDEEQIQNKSVLMDLDLLFGGEE